MNIQEYQRETRCQTYPQHDQAHYETNQRRNGREVSKGLGSQESGICVLFHSSKTVLFLSMEHVWYLRHDVHLRMTLGFVSSAQREGVDT